MIKFRLKNHDMAAAPSKKQELRAYVMSLSILARVVPEKY